MAHGHRSVPHTADLRVQAWANTRAECVTEAVLAVLESFVGFDGLQPARTVTFQATGRSDADLLVATLDEVIYLLDVTGDIPATTEATDSLEGLRVRFGLAPLPADRVVGATPKAVTLHELEFGRADGYWRCAVTLDT